MADADRSEKATAKHRKQATDKGQFAYSQELTSVMTLIACMTTVAYFLEEPAGFRTFFSSMLQQATSGDNLSLVHQTGSFFLSAAAPVFAAAIVAALAGNFLQGLPVFASDKVGLDFTKLNPIQGFTRLKGQMSWVQWLKLIGLVATVGLIAWKVIAGSWEQIVTLSVHSIDSSTAIFRILTFRIITDVMVVVGILAIADFFIQRWKFEKSIKQTKAEVKEDAKSSEGNPAIKNKIRSIQRETARRRMMSRVKDADVIVTNPTHYAVALEYKPETMAAPRVIAKGRNIIAEKIKALGREHDIPTVENVPLARALY